MPRVTSALWVAAFVRRVNADGTAAAVVAAKGAEEAGQILIHVDRLDGTGDLYVPAPQALYGEAADERRFVARSPGRAQANAAIAETIARERRFDPDLWVVGIDDRAGRHFLGDLLAATD